MIIETDPCSNCDFNPEFCGADIDLCMMNLSGGIISDEEYKHNKEEMYKKAEELEIRRLNHG